MVIAHQRAESGDVVALTRSMKARTGLPVENDSNTDINRRRGRAIGLIWLCALRFLFVPLREIFGSTFVHAKIR